MEGRMGRSDSCLSPIPGPGVGDFNHRHEPPRSTIGDFFGACNAQSNLIPNVFPFLAPLKGPSTDRTNLRGPIPGLDRSTNGSSRSLSTHQRPSTSTSCKTQQLKQGMSKSARSTGACRGTGPKHSADNSLAKINTYLRIKKPQACNSANVIV